MKLVLAFFLISGALVAQPGSAKDVNRDPNSTALDLVFEIVSFLAKFDSEVNHLTPNQFAGALLLTNVAVPHVIAQPLRPQTSSSNGIVNLPYSTVDTVVAPFFGYYPGAPIRYTSSLGIPAARAGALAALTTAPPVAPPDPQMIFLDGLGNSLVAFDLTTQTVSSQVVVPSTVGPFGVRPSASGPSNEVWVANYGLQISVADLGAQAVTATIPTPGLPSSAPPVGIVFTPDGTKAFEAVPFYSPDASGNNGALLVFDAVKHALTSTLLRQNGPVALLMAPDGLTLYLLESSNSGVTITYYDVLSGTADLTVSTATPGVSAGIEGGSIFIHPDGTRLFWNENYQFNVFDLTTRKVTQQFTSGLPSTAGPGMTMSQDGARAIFSDRAGDVVVLDTLNGTILASYNTGYPTSAYGGPPLPR
jgi:hypothetical protein